MPSVLHIAHFEPPIHGEAMMACRLQEVAHDWDGIRYHSINAVYSTERGDLGGFSFRKLLLLVRYLMLAVRAKFKHRADVLLIHQPFHPGPFFKGSLFIWLGVLLRMKVIAWVHMDPARIEIDRRPWWFRKWFFSTLARVDRFVACAPSLPNQWPDWLQQLPHDGVANAIPDPADGGRQATPGKRAGELLRVIYLSAMHQEKGWQDLFHAACRICRHRRDVEFHFHGNAAPADEAALRQTFASSPYPERIQWLGPVWNAEKFHRLCDADLFVFPSHTEQFPLAILEAMACGLAVVTTDVGAVRDVFPYRAKAGGELIPIAQPEVLESALSRLLADREALSSAGLANRRAFLELGTLDRFQNDWAAVIAAN